MQIPFEELEIQYKPLIYQIIKTLHLYGDRNMFYQTGLIGLWEASIRFDPSKGATFGTFAYSTIRGKLLDHLNHERKYAELFTPSGEELFMNLVDCLANEPFENEIISLYCENLTRNQVRWVQARIIEDKDYKEIASEYNVSVDAVKSWGKQAIKNLRSTITDWDMGTG
ncbi:sigma-70 family RNA polymerase sigma factor [Fredinandcohnia humi]